MTVCGVAVEILHDPGDSIVCLYAATVHFY